MKNSTSKNNLCTVKIISKNSKKNSVKVSKGKKILGKESKSINSMMLPKETLGKSKDNKSKKSIKSLLINDLICLYFNLYFNNPFTKQ